MSPDEWLRKLDKENGCIEDDDEPNLQLQRGGRTRSSQKKKKKGKDQQISLCFHRLLYSGLVLVLRGFWTCRTSVEVFVG